MNVTLKIILLLAVTLLSSCISRTEEDMELDVAYGEIGSAIEYKAGVCGQRPHHPLIIPVPPNAYGVHLCALQIIRSECPFNYYPSFCLEMYTNVCEYTINGKKRNPCDLPLIGP